MSFVGFYSITPWGVNDLDGYFEEPPTTEGSWAPNYLVSFVPESLFELAQAGIEVNPEPCIDWLANTGTHLLELIRDDPRASKLL